MAVYEFNTLLRVTRRLLPTDPHILPGPFGDDARRAVLDRVAGVGIKGVVSSQPFDGLNTIGDGFRISRALGRKDRPTLLPFIRHLV